MAAIPQAGTPEFAIYWGWVQSQADPPAPRTTYAATKAKWCANNPTQCVGGTPIAGAKTGGAMAAAGSATTTQVTVVKPPVTPPLTAAAKAGNAVASAASSASDFVSSALGQYAKYLPYAGGAIAIGVVAWYFMGRKKQGA